VTQQRATGVASTAVPTGEPLAGTHAHRRGSLALGKNDLGKAGFAHILGQVVRAHAPADPGEAKAGAHDEAAASPAHSSPSRRASHEHDGGHPSDTKAGRLTSKPDTAPTLGDAAPASLVEPEQVDGTQSSQHHRAESASTIEARPHVRPALADRSAPTVATVPVPPNPVAMATAAATTATAMVATVAREDASTPATTTAAAPHDAAASATMSVAPPTAPARPASSAATTPAPSTTTSGATSAATAPAPPTTTGGAAQAATATTATTGGVAAPTGPTASSQPKPRTQAVKSGAPMHPSVIHDAPGAHGHATRNRVDQRRSIASDEDAGHAPAPAANLPTATIHTDAIAELAPKQFPPAPPSVAAAARLAASPTPGARVPGARVPAPSMGADSAEVAQVDEQDEATRSSASQLLASTSGESLSHPSPFAAKPDRSALRQHPYGAGHSVFPTGPDSHTSSATQNRPPPHDAPAGMVRSPRGTGRSEPHASSELDQDPPAPLEQTPTPPHRTSAPLPQTAPATSKAASAVGGTPVLVGRAEWARTTRTVVAQPTPSSTQMPSKSAAQVPTSPAQPKADDPHGEHVKGTRTGLEASPLFMDKPTPTTASAGPGHHATQHETKSTGPAPVSAEPATDTSVAAAPNGSGDGAHPARDALDAPAPSIGRPAVHLAKQAPADESAAPQASPLPHADATRPAPQAETPPQVVRSAGHHGVSTPVGVVPGRPASPRNEDRRIPVSASKSAPEPLREPAPSEPADVHAPLPRAASSKPTPSSVSSVGGHGNTPPVRVAGSKLRAPVSPTNPDSEQTATLGEDGEDGTRRKGDKLTADAPATRASHPPVDGLDGKANKPDNAVKAAAMKPAEPAAHAPAVSGPHAPLPQPLSPAPSASTSHAFASQTLVQPGIPSAQPFQDPAAMSAASGPQAAILDRATDDPGLAVTVLPHVAHVSIASSTGELALHVRVRDGNADVNVSGSMAPLFDAKAPEVRTVLAGEGLNLGSFSTDQHGGQGYRQGQPESGPNIREQHQGPPPRHSAPTASQAPHLSDRGIHVTA
jgi:hypothetical protein